MARTELPNGVILPAEYSDDWFEDMTSNLTKLDDVIGSDSEKLNADGVDFLRMSSAALTDGGTGNFSDLNSSYKIKTGDFVLDSGRKLYQVVSVDSTNERFTVGNSLFKVTAESDLAPVAESGDYDDLDNKPDLNPYDQHIANTDIHVTTADKNRWNNQTYVFRYSSTALTASSTNSNALLDNTDNLKVGDKVIDSSGVLFSITAIDTQNSTFTIGTALIDLAQDSNVVHKSDNETINGIKTFSNYVRINRSSPSIQMKSTTYSSETSSAMTIGEISLLNNNGSFSTWIVHQLRDDLTKRLCFRVYPHDNSAYKGFAFDDSCNLYPENSNSALGTPTQKWKTLNGLEPSSLSLPSDRSARIDISSYFTNTGTGNTNEYSVPANGFIFLNLLNAFAVICYSIDGTNNINYAQSYFRPADGQIYVCFPVRKNDIFRTLWTANGGTIIVTSAHFIPCLGNV